jgi:putative PIN family toxin of toxin-antitoxin system
MRPRAVYDTNVIVSAVLKEGSIPGELLRFAREGRVSLFVSPEILEEYRFVLKRAKFALAEQTVEAFLEKVVNAGTLVHPDKRVNVAREDADNRFLECALKAKAAYLVTGNRKDFPDLFEGTAIVSPREFREKALVD